MMVRVLTVKYSLFTLLIFNLISNLQCRNIHFCYLYATATRGICVEIDQCYTRRKFLSFCNYNRNGTNIICCPTYSINPIYLSMIQTTEKPKLIKSNKKPRKQNFDKENNKIEEITGDEEMFEKNESGKLARKKCFEYSERIEIDQRHIYTNCGKRKKRIIGGKEEEEKSHPHMAALGYLIDDQIRWSCGGSLISEQFVLTAGHCLRQNDGPLTYVRLGRVNLESPISPGTDFKVAATIKHPRFRDARYNDIGLVKLITQVRFSDRIQPACLDTLSLVPEKTAEAAGWGQTRYDDYQLSERLMSVTIPLVTRQICGQYHQNDHTKSLTKGISESQLCAGNLTYGGIDTCNGDSGGPLTVLRTENKCRLPYIVGVTSFGIFCGFPNAPGVYTRTSAFVGWIEHIVWPNEVYKK